jgi:hypothetical protein
MDIFEDFGGCLMIGVIAAIVLLVIICVAVVIFGVAISDFTG